MKKSRIIVNAVIVSAFILLGVAGLVFLWGGRGGDLSYREMACSFEGGQPFCLDTNEDWNSGLRFYDSTLSVTSDTLQSLKSLLWDFWNIEFAGSQNASSSKDVILPLTVLKNKKSGCVGLVWLAMMVAEARQIHLQPILLPGHVFLRYESVLDGSRPSINLEPNRRGYAYTDEEYREKYKDGPWTGLEFKPLLSRQFFGLAAFDMGNLYLEQSAPDALKWYRLAEEMFPEYPGISVNQKIAKKRLPDHL